MGADETGLRARLVAAGVDLVLREGQSAVSLREIARRAGVSHGAPRRYFPTHVDLLSAIAREGFADLTAQVERTLRDVDPDPRTRLTALARTYLDFAAAHRGMFELMFRHDLLDSGRLRLRETSLPLFAVLADLVAQARRPTDAPAAVLAGALWANLHGIAQLWAWGSLPLATGATDDDALLRAALDAHLGPAPA
ncbi:TetR/AcrR family transcriptional regulator [Micromonospora sp. PSH03]|uniref:TetR/AcrR family transcriptional regulator n=1 Tax=Micromonospora TaxID=1873 RepID=UPI001B35E550|nr:MULTISPECIES: TetR/AcrR family transcriptional regulator [Micromonospora]MBQ0992476.1 TetR/AcrR family transcriptional regulator [Micromonospora sp. H61]MCG5458769.1 TetR/AcrR family transcriptional regulator [Micromonospora salmantinae]